ncbi:hypothetical protein CR513_44286, partial [Mucuna pruriens]
MGEKELMIITPLPVKYVKGDEEALETSFQALEIVGTTNAEAEEGGSKLSRVAIMAAKVLINNGLQFGKGLSKDLDSIAEPVTLQKNPGRFKLGYTRVVEERRPGWKVPGKKWIRPDLYRYFTSVGIISPDQIARIKDQLPKIKEWIVPTSQELDNWTAEALPELLSNASESCGQDDGENLEEEAPIKMEWLLEQERPKLQSGAKELETINLGEEVEKQEIRVGKQMPLGLKQKLVELLRKYADVFA